MFIELYNTLAVSTVRVFNIYESIADLFSNTFIPPESVAIPFTYVLVTGICDMFSNFDYR